VLDFALEPDDAIPTINFNYLAIQQDLGRIDQARYARLAILPGHQRAMLEHAAYLKDNAGGIKEEWRPARVGRSGDKDLARQDRFFVRLVEHLDLTLYHAGRDRLSCQLTLTSLFLGRSQDPAARVDDAGKVMHMPDPFESLTVSLG
jgi:hypothetical protein